MRRLALLPAVLIFGCATGTPVGGRVVAAYRPFAPAAVPRAEPPLEQAAEVAPLRVAPGSRARVVATARDLVGKPRVQLPGQSWSDDCSGLVRGVFSQVGVDLMAGADRGDNGVTAIYRFASRHGRIYDGGRPLPGDIVFFRDTYDQNRDGRSNDGLTHVGIVDDVAEDGTVSVIHRVARGIVRYRMNVAQPDAHSSASGAVINDYLRPAGSARRVLTGQLFAGYGTLLPVESRLATR